MGKTDLQFQQNEAKWIITEILSKQETITCWLKRDASKRLNNIGLEWKNFCQNIQDFRSSYFQQKIIEYLGSLTKFQETILEKVELYELMVQDRLEAFRILSGNDKNNKSIVENLLSNWNKTIKPQSIFLYEKSEQLEARIKHILHIRNNSKE